MALKQVKCKKAVEDDSCILNSCKHNHKLIFLRHDYLVGKIAKELKLYHDTADIWVERHSQQDLQLVKPEIAMVKDEHCIIIEVTCPYESRMNTSNKGYVTK